jgi:threonine dehydratase
MLNTTLKSKTNFSRIKINNLIEKASSRIYDVVKKTKLEKTVNLSQKNNIYLKREDMQNVYSFKIRGAYNKILELSDSDKNKSIFACSAGNHAQGVAFASSQLNLKTSIVMPIKTPQIKINNVKKYGGNIILHGNNFNEAKKKCTELVKQNDGIMIDPFDDIHVIAGQGTVGKEIYNQLPEVDYVFFPIGGGGLIAGSSVYLKNLNKNIKIIGVQTYDSNSMYLSLKSDTKQVVSNVGLFSDGTAVGEVGDLPLDICRKTVDDVILVDTDDICLAIQDIYNETRTIMEPAGALSVAGMKKYIYENKIQNKNIVSVLTGANMDFKKLRFIADRATVKNDNEVLFAISMPEKPGTFLKLYENIYPRNVLEFSYRYSDNKEANIFISFAVKTKQDMHQVIRDLETNIDNCKIIDISEDELAKTHLRFLIGGKIIDPPIEMKEKIISFEFPENPGVLKNFLIKLPSKWNVSLFHYRNYGDDIGRVLAGIQIPIYEEEKLIDYLEKLDYPYKNESNHILYKKCLG